MITHIALGSNLGDRSKNLAFGFDQLRALAQKDTPFRTSPIYQTAPVDCPEGSPYFLNAVAEFSTALSPDALLTALQEIEIRAGREPSSVRNAPRTLDLDILMYGNEKIDQPELKIPHPRITERLFMLKPLSDLIPQARLTENEPTLKDICNTFMLNEMLSGNPLPSLFES